MVDFNCSVFCMCAVFAILCLMLFLLCLFVFCTWRREPRPRVLGHCHSPSARMISQLKVCVLHIHVL